MRLTPPGTTRRNIFTARSLAGGGKRQNRRAAALVDIGPDSAVISGLSRLRVSPHSRNKRPMLFTFKCEVCDSLTTHVASVPAFGPHPELLTYRCRTCGHVETLEAG